MWSSCLSTNASRLRLHIEQFSQTRWTLADLRNHKGQERPLYNWVEGNKGGKKKRRGSGWDPCPWSGGAEGAERFPHSGKPPHQWGDGLGQESIWSCQRRADMLVGTERTEWDPHRWSVSHSWAPLPGTCAQQWAWRLGAGTWRLENKCRENCSWMQGDSLRGWEWGYLQPGMLAEETQTN